MPAPKDTKKAPANTSRTGTSSSRPRLGDAARQPHAEEERADGRRHLQLLGGTRDERARGRAP